MTKSPDNEVSEQRTGQISIFISVFNILMTSVMSVLLYTQSNDFKNQDLKIEYVKLATSILNQNNDNTGSQTKDWAIKVINKYSDVPMDKEAQDEIKSNGLTIISPKYNNLIADYLLKLESNPNDILTLNQLGYAYFKMGILDSAEFYLKKSITIDKTYTWGHYNLSLVYWKEGREKDSIAELKEAIKYDTTMKATIKNDTQFQDFKKNEDFINLLK